MVHTTACSGCHCPRTPSCSTSEKDSSKFPFFEELTPLPVDLLCLVESQWSVSVTPARAPRKQGSCTVWFRYRNRLCIPRLRIQRIPQILKGRGVCTVKLLHGGDWCIYKPHPLLACWCFWKDQTIKELSSPPAPLQAPRRNQVMGEWREQCKKRSMKIKASRWDVRYPV